MVTGRSGFHFANNSDSSQGWFCRGKPGAVPVPLRSSVLRSQIHIQVTFAEHLLGLLIVTYLSFEPQDNLF
jgi:hypothetical protein